MSRDRDERTFGERIAGKWQLPLAAVAALVFAGTVMWVRPRPERPAVDQCRVEIESLRQGLLLQEAEALARSVLQDERYAEEELGPIYTALADTLYRVQAPLQKREHRELINILALYTQAEVLGDVPDGNVLRRMGQLYEWLGQPANAAEQYRRALKRQPSDPLAVRRSLLALQLEVLATPREELHQGLDELLDAAGDQPKTLSWALEHKINLLIREQRLDEGRRLIRIHQPRLRDPASEQLLSYLDALLAYKSGDFDSAELTLRELRDRLEVRDDLHVRSGWLLGRVVLMDGGPQRPLEAMSFFEDALDSHTTGKYVSGARLGMAEALTDLERFDEAQEHYRQVLKDLGRLADNEVVNREAVRGSLMVRSQLLREKEQYDDSLAYLQLATDLVPLEDEQSRRLYLRDLALMKQFQAERKREQFRARTESEDPAETRRLAESSRALFLSAAEDYLSIAKLSRSDESLAADALWQAASMYDAAGRGGEAIQLLEDFMATRPNSPQIPLALFRLGQAYQAQGRLRRAVELYQRCIRDYRQTTAAQWSYIPLADCFVLLGPEYSDRAEETLLAILEEPPGRPPMFTPDAMIYRDALFKLGDLYSRTGRPEAAIEWLDEALQRYPEDPRHVRATFLLADAYLQSGLKLEELSAEVTSGLQRDEMQTLKRERLSRAEGLFDRVIRKLSHREPQELDDFERLQLEHSYAYRADSAFDLGDHARALGLYQEIVRVYQDQPIALWAYLQMINCYEVLGRVEEIKPALERAEWLTDKIDPAAFLSLPLRSSPEDWHRLFAWIEQTGDYGSKRGGT